jgi:hypothetical protein
MLHPTRAQLLLALLVTAATLTPACGDDDDGPQGSSGGASGEAGESNGSVGGTSDGGALISGRGGSDGGAAGRNGQPPFGLGGSTDGGGGVESVAGSDASGGIGGADASAGTAHGGDGNLPHARACPDIGQTFTVTLFSDAADIALAAELGCDVSDVDAYRELAVTRFEVNAPSVAVVWSPHNLIDVYDAFALQPDCAEIGVEKPTYTNYPNTLAQLLSAGVYTRLTCAANAESVVEPAPVAATNVDCAHALPLPQPATRVMEASRFYGLTLSGAANEVEFNLPTEQTNSGVSGTLRRIGGAFEATSELPYMVGTLGFDDVPAGDYCLEISADQGVSYGISIAYIDYL